MSSTDTPTKLRGIVAPLPPGTPCRVALVDGDAEYAILPRGAGIDLADMVSAQLEVLCTIKAEGDDRLLHVRSYTVLDGPDEDSWFDNDA